MDEPSDRAGQVPCSLFGALEVVGERWSFLIVREALAGTSRFAEFRARLGLAPDVLSSRLSALVADGVLERREYREPGQRARMAYHLTRAGRELALVVGALQQWGDEHSTVPIGPSVAYRSSDGRPVRVLFVDEDEHVVEPDDIRVVRDRPTAATARVVPRGRGSVLPVDA